MQDRHCARRATVQVIADRMLQQGDADDVFLLRHADTVAEVADRLRRVASTTDAGNRRHSRIVPAADVPLLDERE